MNKSTIQTLIDKVIGKKGLIRVPSWWMRKVLMQIADWVQERDDANNKKIVKVKKEADEKISTLETNVNTLETNTNSKINNLETNVNTLDTNTNNILFDLVRTAKPQISIKCFAVQTKSLGGFVIVDGIKQSIPVNTKSAISFINEFRFGDQSSSSNGISFIGFSLTDTSAITDMSYMFNECQHITSLNLSGFNTSKVTNMLTMFGSCLSLNSLDLLSFNTSAVTDMGYMFYYCTSLTSIDLSSFNTSSVWDMQSMFENCTSLTSLDLSNFNTSKVELMTEMFTYCSSLTSLDLSGFDTSAVTSMQEMFSYCTSLTSLDLSGFNTPELWTAQAMFRRCDNLIFLDLSRFDTSGTAFMDYMFSECSSIASLVLGPNFFKTKLVTSVDFSSLKKWTNDTVVTSLVTNSYDRATAGLKTMTLKLSANTKAALTDEQKAAITAKGYTIA